jgi:hypothetical protein
MEITAIATSALLLKLCATLVHFRGDSRDQIASVIFYRKVKCYEENRKSGTVNLRVYLPNLERTERCRETLH